jgi:peptidylprolyl isomerase
MSKHFLIACVLLLSVTSATAADFAKVRYSIRNLEGKLIEASAEGQAAVMAVDRMIPEWREAVKSMAAGEKKTVRTAEYDIETELLEIIKGPDTPAELTAPPAEAEKTRSGLAFKVLREGTGVTKPRRRSTVRVNYSGWSGDGRLFDSTVLRGQPAEFRLDNVIDGWTEGLQMMVEGEVRRFWIPAKLAYAKEPGKPQGMLVFDIELIEVK